MKRVVWIFAALWLGLRPALAGDVTVAVAANFLTTAEALAEAFEAESEHEVVLAHGSTGGLYAQIVSGAPFDIFLSADMARPGKLREDGQASSVRTYAFGRLVLVSRGSVDLENAATAFEGRRVALADPMVAPYGNAAVSAMENLRLDTATFQPLLVSNVGQVATLFVTGNAEMAFVAEAQVPLLSGAQVVPLEGRYSPIRQDAALLDRAGDNEAAMAFWAFLASDSAYEVIEAAGYDLP